MKKINQMRNALAITLLLASGFLFSSCMHLGMLGHGEHHEPTSESTLEKEVIAGDVKAVATFPSLESGKEARFTLRLFHSRTLRPLSGAQVFGHFDFIHRVESPDAGHMGVMHGQTDSSHAYRTESEHAVSWHQELEESKEPGEYTFSQIPYQLGEYTVAFHITAIGARKLEPEILIEVKRTVADKTHSHGEGMMGVKIGRAHV